MASRNNNNSNNNNNTASSNDAGGFKTVAFGFDKNDVTLYIANLRKKMKEKEDEFEERLAAAVSNPVASNDAMRHEREVIRAEMERSFNDKIKERTLVIKRQQEQIEELTRQVREDKNTIDSLNAQLVAATSEDNPQASANARAAKAYMQFTAELRHIADSAQKTLAKVNDTWKGKFDTEGFSIDESSLYEAEETAPAESAKAEQPAVQRPSDMKPDTAIDDTFGEAEDIFGAASAGNDDEMTNDLSPSFKTDDDDINDMMVTDDEPAAEAAASEKEKPAAEIDDDLSSFIIDEPAPAPKAAPKPAPVAEPEPPKAAPKPAPKAVSSEFDAFAAFMADGEDDIDSSLVADISADDNSSVAVDIKTGGDDLGDDILLDVIKAANDRSGDLNAMLQEHQQSEDEELSGMFVPEEGPAKVGESEFSVPPSDESVKIVGENEQFNVQVKEVDPDDILPPLVPIEEMDEDGKVVDNDPFNFSFDESDGDDEDDDMSASMSGML